jgi:hypothetical protein
MSQFARLALALLSIAILDSPTYAIHLSFTNSSAFPSNQVYVWFGGAAEAGYDLKRAGQTQNITLGQSIPLSDLASGVTLNRLISGRVYFSLGEPLPDPGRNGAGSPLRYPGVSPGNEGYDVRWDFIELTNTPAAGDVADLTSMDNFAIPLKLQLKHQGSNFTGPNTSAGWKGHTDAQIIAALSPLADPAGSNLYRPGGKFVRVNGANSFPTVYQNHPTDPKSMTAYIASIKAAGRTTVFDGHAFGVDYQYSAALDATGNYVLTKTGGAAGNPTTILVPASYKAGPNPADPIVTLAESIYMSNPWYGVDGGPVGPTQNNLAGAITRDLYAALNLGYVNSNHVVAAGDTVNPALVGKYVYELTGSQLRQLTVGFAEVNEFHNIYAAAIRELSDSYGYAYSDWNEHLSKVAVLINQAHSGIIADELNIEVAGSRLMPGDFNSDGLVDAADYTVWRNAQSGPVSAGHPADGNFDGSVNSADYDLWKANFGTSIGGGAMDASPGVVPEPNTVAFVLMAFAYLTVCTAARNPRGAR